MVGKAGNFALQFGVFSSVPNSERMIARLGKMGVKPAINTRVLAGPYADRRVAENEKKKLGMDAILIDLPGKGYALQVGDFESLEHARALAEKLKRQGIAVMTQTRIRGGAYKSRKSAQAAAARYGKSGLPAFVVRP